MRIYAVYAVTETYYSGYDSDPKPGIPIQRLTKRKFKVKAKAKVETVAGYVVGDRSMFRIDPIVKRNGCGYINSHIPLSVNNPHIPTTT